MRLHHSLITCTLSLSLSLSMLAAAPALAQTSGCATVEVDNVRAQKGHLMVAAFGNAQSFGKEPLSALRLQVGDTTRMSFQLCGLSGSEVALTLFQDLDSDGKMGRNMLGVPTEPWGASGTPGTFGPSWDTAKVALDGKPIAVKLSQ